MAKERDYTYINKTRHGTTSIWDEPDFYQGGEIAPATPNRSRVGRRKPYYTAPKRKDPLPTEAKKVELLSDEELNGLTGIELQRRLVEIEVLINRISSNPHRQDKYVELEGIHAELNEKLAKEVG